MSGCWLVFDALSFGLCSRLEVLVVLKHFLPPTLPPAPLCPPPGAERGALIWFRRAGYASTASNVATASSLADWQAYGRRELARRCALRLAAAPASGKTCPTSLVHSRSRSDRCRWHAKTQPFTTTAGQQCQPANHGGDASCHRSLSRLPTTKSRLPSLPPAGGREGRGGEWGEETPSETTKACRQPKR